MGSPTVVPGPCSTISSRECAGGAADAAPCAGDGASALVALAFQEYWSTIKRVVGVSRVSVWSCWSGGVGSGSPSRDVLSITDG